MHNRIVIVENTWIQFSYKVIKILCLSVLNIDNTLYIKSAYISIVCVEVLWPSQPNRVMSSAVHLPNHTFTGQA